MDFPEIALPSGRQKLVNVIQQSTDVIRTEDVVCALSVSRSQASKLLWRWTSQGWLRRVGRGAYVTAPMEFLDCEYVLTDPWVLVPALYGPAYVGGLSAIMYWDLTDQIFRNVTVMTTRTLRTKQEVRHGIHFDLRHVSSKKMFGTKPAWTNKTRVLVSDVHRTVVDMLDTPAVGGGSILMAESLERYLRHDLRNDKRLIEYADRFGNGAVFKRLGFLVENRSDSKELLAACRSRLTRGNAKLEPRAEGGRLVTRWRLWVPHLWNISPAEAWKARHNENRKGAMP